MFGSPVILVLLIPGQAFARKHRGQGHHNYGYHLELPPLSSVSSSELPIVDTTSTSSILQITSILPTLETPSTSPTIPTESTTSSTSSTSSTSLTIPTTFTEPTTTSTSSVTLTSTVTTTSATIAPPVQPTFYIRDATQQYQISILDDLHAGILYYEEVPGPEGNLTMYTLDEQQRLEFVSPGFVETGWVGATTPRGDVDYMFIDPNGGDLGIIFTACQCLINPPTSHLSCKCPNGFIDSTFIPDRQPLYYAPWQAFPVVDAASPTSASLPRPTFVIRDATQEHELSLFYDNPLDEATLPSGNPYVGVRTRQPLGPNSALFTLNERGDIIYATPGSPLQGKIVYQDGDYNTLFDRGSPQAAGSSECIATIVALTWELVSTCAIGGSPQGCWPWELCTDWYVYLVNPSDVSIIERA